MNFKKIKLSLVLSLFFIEVPSLLAGPFAPEAGAEGTTAISNQSPLIESWASQVISFTLGEGLSPAWQDRSQALGPAEGTVFNVSPLGRGGTLTLAFGRAFSDQAGPDLAVFENAFNDHFLELAFVEASSDGVHFFRFPNQSLTLSPLGGTSLDDIEPTDIQGLAGKYRQGYGVPFDLSDLEPSAHLDLQAVRFIRLVDVIGGTAEGVTQSRDSTGHLIFDPFPTNLSAGFDCDGVALLRPIPNVRGETTQNNFIISWPAEPNASYQVLFSQTLGHDWQALDDVSTQSPSGRFTTSLQTSSKRFFRIVRKH